MSIINKITDLSGWVFGARLKKLIDIIQQQDNKDVKITITIRDTRWEYTQKKNKGL